MNIVAIIPARGGSKGVPRKNIKLLNGKPLISYAICETLKSKYINRVIVSTDDKEIAEVAKKYKAEIPFIRPQKFARDSSTTLSVLKHAVKYLEREEKYKPDLIVLIQPTSPLVLIEDIDMAIEKLIITKTNSCVSICEITERPEWMYILKESNKLKSFLKIRGKKTARQQLPEIFHLNGAVYVVKTDVLMKKSQIIDETNCSAIIMPLERSVDIDNPVDFLVAGAIMRFLNENSMKENHHKSND